MMSTNCITCGVKRRTRSDLLCDECRDGGAERAIRNELDILLASERGTKMLRRFIGMLADGLGSLDDRNRRALMHLIQLNRDYPASMRSEFERRDPKTLRTQVEG